MAKMADYRINGGKYMGKENYSVDHVKQAMSIQMAQGSVPNRGKSRCSGIWIWPKLGVFQVIALTIGWNMEEASTALFPVPDFSQNDSIGIL